MVADIEDAYRGAGFDFRLQVLDAADYGVPQHRNRVFIVGLRDAAARAAFRWPAPTHGAGGLLGLASYVTVRAALGLAGAYAKGRRANAKGWQGQRHLDVDAPSPTIGTKGNDEWLTPDSGFARVIDVDRPAPALTTKEDALICGGQGQRVIDIDAPCTTIGTSRSPDFIVPLDPRKRRLGEGVIDVDAPSRTLTAGHETDFFVAVGEAGLLDRPSTTLSTDPRMAPAGHHVRQQRGAVRLNIAQKTILMGFPATFVCVGSKTSQHRQLGNAVPPALGAAAGRSIMAALNAAAARAA